MKTVIMAGGKGTRIRSVVSDIPKPMIPIGGIPVLEREIKSLANQGFTDIIITISHLGKIIQDYFGDGEKFGVKIEYFDEKEPLGNAGALFQLRNKLTEPFLLINGDVVFDVDFKRMIKFHQKTGGLVTLLTHPNDHPYDSGLIITDQDLSVKQWLSKEDPRPTYYKNRVNAGIHIIDPKVISLSQVNINQTKKVDLDRQLLKPLANRHLMFCYNSPEYVKDMGTPERLQQVERDYKAGKITAKNLSKKQKAVFLDRDGTINLYKGFLTDINDFELIPGITDIIKQINQSGYLCIVVTNQPVIARGEVTYQQLEKIHNKMETLLGLKGAFVDGLYFCPHHPDKGFEGEIPELKIKCQCRKPKPGMLLQAARDFNIDLSKSWMVGDSESDIQAGKTAGCQTLLTERDSPDFSKVLKSI